MKTEKDLNDKIIELTNKIRANKPELVKYIDEMPLTLPDNANPEINEKNLKEYIKSLKDLLNKTT